MLALEIIGVGAGIVLLVVLVLVFRAWPLEATLKAKSGGPAISLAAGVSFAGVSASAAAILDGPGVIAVHVRAREVWRRSIERVSVEAAMVWIDELVSGEKKKDANRARGLAVRVKDWLVPRTDVKALPDLGLRVVRGLKDVELRGGIHCGFEDPGVTGKAAALLFPLAAVLSPLGRIDVSFDWSGKTVLDGDVELSCRVIPARVVYEGLRFARAHVHVSVRKDDHGDVIEQQ